MLFGELSLYYCIIPYYKKENFFRWFLGNLVTVVEGTPFNHVWLSLSDNNGNRKCVDLSGYNNTPKEYDKLKSYYNIFAELKFHLNETEYDNAVKALEKYKDVKYSYLKFFVFLINKNFKTKLFFNKFDCISTELIGRILKETNENFYVNAPQLCGLNELNSLL
jgi:hypothetical protein